MYCITFFKKKKGSFKCLDKLKRLSIQMYILCEYSSEISSVLSVRRMQIVHAIHANFFFYQLFIDLIWTAFSCNFILFESLKLI